MSSVDREATVAPHAGAWIETIPISFSSLTTSVAPHAGAWIRRHLLRWNAPSRINSITSSLFVLLTEFVGRFHDFELDITPSSAYLFGQILNRGGA